MEDQDLLDLAEVVDQEEVDADSDSFGVEIDWITGLPVTSGNVSYSDDVWVYDSDYGVQTYALNPIESSDGLKGVLLDVLGPYDAVVVEYRYQTTTSGNYQYVREIQYDWPWLGSLAVFLVLLWSVFRIAGGFICRK